MTSNSRLSPAIELTRPGSAVFDLPAPILSKHFEQRTASEEYESQTTDLAPTRRSPGSSARFMVISGGTGGNSICSAFLDACYALPVSDDGGSSSEIIRVLGGPSIGDIRSRLVRLIPSAPTRSPLDAIRVLLAYRLPSHDREAREQWRDIVEGKSSLWIGIPDDRKETIRGFLVYFESEILKRAHKSFSFVNGSIGNYFLAAAQGFFRSLPSAIFLFSSITNSQANIVPVIVTNHTVTIAAELENGERLVGQCEISHPVTSTSAQGFTGNDTFSPIDGMGLSISQRNNIMFDRDSKDTYELLPSPITRLYYMNAYANEIFPVPNPDYISNLSTKDVLVYSCGSLWTSIIPCLAMRGVSAAITHSRSLRAKILLLNSENDRETDGYNAIDYIRAIAQTLNVNYQPESYSLGNANTTYPISAFITHVVYIKGTTIKVDVARIASLGVKCVEIRDPPRETPPGTPPRFEAKSVRRAIDEILASEEGAR